MTEVMHYIRRKIGGKVFWFDKEDQELVEAHSWYVNSRRCGKEYLVREQHLGREGPKGSRKSLRKTIIFHRLIMDAPKGMVVDHINGNTRDNRRCNLRVCTQSQNTQNGRKHEDNTSGYKGVFFWKTRGCWKAVIMAAGKVDSKGQYKTAEEAARAYDEKAKRLHGPFAKLNFPENV